VTERRRLSRDELTAYVDGQLDPFPHRKAAVDAFLRTHPEARAEARAYALQNEALRAAFDPVLSEPIPDRLRDASPRLPLPRNVSAAAALAMALIAGAMGWLMGASAQEDPHDVQALVERTLVALVGEAPRVDAPARGTPALHLDLPDLAAKGLELTDEVRVGPSEEGTFVARYRDGSGRDLFILAAPHGDPKPSEVRLLRRDDLSIAWWVNGPFLYAVAGELPEPEVLELAHWVGSVPKWAASADVATATGVPAAGGGAPAIDTVETVGLPPVELPTGTVQPAKSSIP